MPIPKAFLYKNMTKELREISRERIDPCRVCCFIVCIAVGSLAGVGSFGFGRSGPGAVCQIGDCRDLGLAVVVASPVVLSCS